MPTENSRQTTTAGALAVTIVVLLAVASGLAVRASGLQTHLDYDSANYAYVATRMTDHGEHYLERYNNKPPGIYWWYQAFFATFGNDPVVCHLTSLVPDLLVAVLLFPLGVQLSSRRTGALAVALYLMLALQARMAGYGFTESPLTLATVAAALLAVRVAGVERRLPPGRERATLAAAGALMGLAALFKQPALLQLAGLGAWLVLASGKPERRTRALAMLSGFVGVCLALGLWLVSEGLLGTFLSRVLLEGAQHGYDDGYHAAERAGRLLQVVVAPMPVVLSVALAGLAVGAARPVRGLTLAMALPILAMCVVSYEVYDHYLIPALPFLCLAAASCLERLPRRAGGGLLLALSLVQLAGNGIHLSGRPEPYSLPKPVDAWIETFRPRDLSLTYQRELAAWVAERVPADEAILSTGSAIPYLSRRENGYRFLGVAPYLGRLDVVGFTDFGAHAAAVQVLVLERWRTEMLSEEFFRELESGAAGFRPVPAFDHPEFTVWERARAAP